MRGFLVVALAAALAAPALAECPNQCSGHGRCTNYKQVFASSSATVPGIALQTAGGTISAHGYDESITKKDSCTCFTRKEDGNNVFAWTGADCSQRTCAYGRSWDGPVVANDEHAYQAECSNRGTCDRATGKCKCYPGFEGKGCRRMSCPNSCSGHGKCKTLKEIAKDRSEDSTAYSAISGFNYAGIQYDNAWDADKIQGCECDAGFRGADCSMVECPSSTDPMGGDGASKGRECSGRGICDFNTGVCKCFATYFGPACEVLKQAHF